MPTPPNQYPAARINTLLICKKMALKATLQTSLWDNIEIAYIHLLFLSLLFFPFVLLSLLPHFSLFIFTFSYWQYYHWFDFPIVTLQFCAISLYFHFYHLACWKSEQYSWYNTKTLWAEKCGVIQAKVSPLLFFFLFLLFFWFSIGKKQCLHHINKSRSDFHSYSLFSSLGKNSELCIQRHTPMFRDQKSGLLMEGSTKNRHIPR